MEIKSGLAPIIFLENGILCTEIQEPLLLKNQKSSLSSEYLRRQERSGRRPELWSVDENWTGPATSRRGSTQQAEHRELRQFLDHSTESHMATSKVQHDKGYSSQLHPLFNSSTKGIQ
nr:hypothetical protein Iba_chr05dCG6090 [Ipomoea batatas]